MASALFRLICPKGVAESWAGWFNRRGVRTAKTVQDSSPLLMLPPESKGGTTSYKFYSLAEKKLVQTHSPSDDDVIRKLRLKCRGSSHGWLALLSPDNDDFFLYNPISRRHIRLPSIINLFTWPAHDSLSSRRTVIKVILSCSPDEDEDNCRAVMVRYYSNPMAFCCPGRSKDWTLMLDEKIADKRGGESYYKDCVYSTRRKLFFGLTADSVQTWDLRDPSSPRLLKIFNVNTVDLEYRYYDFFSLASYAFDSMQHLVVAEQDLLFVIQYMMFLVRTDGSCITHSDESRSDNYRYMTIGFDIYKYDPKKRGCLKYVDGSSLGGLALFVGMHSHSVAIPATQFPELKPNSIYFTDCLYTGRLVEDEDDDEPFRGHDIGVFNYEDKTVSPCYYPCDVGSLKKILPAPVWFFPSRRPI